MTIAEALVLGVVILSVARWVTLVFSRDWSRPLQGQWATTVVLWVILFIVGWALSGR
jgi:hypothetical protein